MSHIKLTSLMEGPKFTSIKDTPKKIPDDLAQSYNDNAMQDKYINMYRAPMGWRMENEAPAGNDRIYLWKSFQMGDKKYLQFGVELNGKCEITMGSWDSDKYVDVDKIPFKLDYKDMDWKDYWQSANKKLQKKDAKRFDKIVKHAMKNWPKYVKMYKK